MLGLVLGSVQPALAAAAVSSQEKVGEVRETGERAVANQGYGVSAEFAYQSVGALGQDDPTARGEGRVNPAMGVNEQDAPDAYPNPPFKIPVPPDEPPLRSMAALSLRVSAPETVGVGEEVTVRVTAVNVGAEKVSGAVVRLDAKNGRGFVDGKSYPLPDLDADERITVELTLRTAGKPGQRLEGWLVAEGGNLIEPARARLRAVVRQDVAEIWQPQVGADARRTRYGHLEIALSADRNGAIAVIHHRGLYGTDESNKELLYRFELNAWDGQGKPVEQFRAPVTLRWYYEEAGLDKGVSPLTLSFMWKNPETGMWERMPTTHDLKGGYIETQTTHFSIFAVQSLNDYATAPTDPFTGLEADLFTGAAQYRYDIPLVVRPGGFSPGLALSYNSRRRDSLQSWGSADSYVGWGWRLQGLPVIRQPQSGVYKLTLGGATYTLHDFNGQWKAAEAPWKLAIAHDVNSTRPGMTDIKRWDVRTSDGTHYILEPVTDFWHCWDYDGSFVLKHEGIWWLTTAIIAGPDDGPEGGGNPYGGLNHKYKVTIDYDAATRTIDIPSSCGGEQDKPHYYDAWPTKMTYTGVAAGHSAEVVFKYASRNDYPPGCPDSATCEPYQNNSTFGVYFHTQRLTDIIVKVDGVVQKRVHLESKIENPSASVGDRRLFLKGVYVYGKGTTTGALPSPLPDTPYSQTYTYTISSGNWNDAWNGRLGGVLDRQGGAATLVYTREMSATLDSIYYLRQLTLDDGVNGGQQTTFYEPTTWDEDAGGYDTVQVKTYNYGGAGMEGKRTRHFFYREGAGDDKRKNGLKKKLVRQVKSNGQWEEVIDYDYALPSGVIGTEADEARFLLSDEQRGRYYNAANFKWFNRSVYEYQTGSQNSGQYGNLTHQYDYLYVNNAWQAQRLRWRTYYPCDYRSDPSACADVFITDRAAREKLWDLRSGWMCEADSLYYYDNNGSWTYKPKRGLLTKIRSAAERDTNNPSSCTGWQTVGTHGYDQWHNRTQTSDGLGHTTTFGYDNYFYAFRTSVTNAKGHQTTYDYDYVLGVTTTVTDVDNGAVTLIQYDDYGRAERMDRPLGAGLDGQSQAQDDIVVYGDYVSASSPPYVHVKRCENVSNGACIGYLESATFYDGRGRVIQEQSESDDAGQIILVNYAYDERGNLEKKSIPYQVSGTVGTYVSPNWNQPYTAYAYDGLDRVLTTTHPDGTVTETAYRYLETAVVDGNDHQQVSEADGFGRMIMSKQYQGSFSAGANFDATVYHQAQYEYDVADRLIKVKAGLTAPYEETTITYDRLGRKTSMTDPDMGGWEYRYDAAGNLRKQRDARNQAICFYYDALNRMMGKTYHQNVSDLDALTCGGAYAVSYTYDDTANGNKGVGRRTGMSDGSGSTSWVYDERGRVTKETKTINGGGVFVTQWQYDALDRMQTMTYPDNEVVTYAYNSQGLATSLTSSLFGSIVVSSAYNAAGQVNQRALGTGGSSAYKQLFTYDANTLRLETLKAGTNADSFNNLLDLSYEYDKVGNIVSITDTAAYGGAQTQLFKNADGTPAYDELNRLKRAQATGGSYGLYGPYTYDYGANGNVTSFEGKGFAYNDSAHKHALTHVDGTQKYWYDENGNMTRRIDGAGQDHTLSYDAENRLVSITKTVGGGFVASYVYDGDGVRVKEQKSNYTRYFVRDYYEKEGTIVRKYYSLGGARVAESYNGVLYFLLTDHLGSTALTTTRTGGRVGELRYYPFGVWRYKWGSPKTSYRYTGQRWDSGTGLYWYRSRWYDPEIGRFIQPDTIVPAPGDPQSLNRYSYVLNNPLRYTDPSGHVFVENTSGVEGCNSGAPLNECLYPEGYPLAGYLIGTTEEDIQQAQAEMQSTGEVILSILLEPADWALTFNRWRQGDFSYWDLAGMLPLIPVSGARVFGKKILSHTDIIPTGQWHHLFSNKIIRQLEKHETLRGVFRRGDILVQALDRESHVGYQTWHRAYDKEVVDWLKRNAVATSDEFIDFLIEIHARSDMRRRFPFALDALQALKTQFR